MWVLRMLQAVTFTDKGLDPSDTPGANTRVVLSRPHLLSPIADQSRFGSRLQFARLTSHHSALRFIPCPHRSTHGSPVGW